MSYLPEHSDLKDLLVDDHTQYLLLTAGSGKPLTGNLYVEEASAPAIYLRPGGDLANYGSMYTSGNTTTFFHVDAGDAVLDLEAKASDNTSSSSIGFFRQTNTSGNRIFTIYDGTGASAVQHQLNAGTGDVDLCQQGGDVTIHTGDLYIDATTGPAVWLREGASSTDYSYFRDEGTLFYVNKISATGNAAISINPQATDGTSICDVRVGRYTNTSGSRRLQLFLGDGTATVQHEFNMGTGDVDLCKQGGGLKVSNGYVQLPYLGSAPASPANGMIWMESDGLHLYYAGAEKLVAGV